MGTPTRRIRHAKKQAFLEAFANVGTIRHAAEKAKVQRTTHYFWMQTDPEYRIAFEQAEQQAIDSLENEARKRAIAGSDTLLIFLLKGARPERYRENAGVAVHVQQYQESNVSFDALTEAESAYLAALAGKSSIETGDAPKPPAISLSGNGVAGPESPAPDS